MNRFSFSVIAFIAVCLCIFPAAATLNLNSIVISPTDEAVAPGTGMNVSADIEIIPSGATTFTSSHTLVLSTGLEDARWNVVVYVNGIQGAVIPQTGNYVFVNGFLLSYPTNRDVSVKVALEGMAPIASGETQFTVFQMQELNNENQPVGGSVQTITRNLTLPSTPVSSPPTTAPPTAPPTTKAPMPAVLVIAALSLMVIFAHKQG
jgi:hypothetical protein